MSLFSMFYEVVFVSRSGENFLAIFHRFDAKFTFHDTSGNQSQFRISILKDFVTFHRSLFHLSTVAGFHN